MTARTNNNKLHLAAVIAAREIQSLEKVYINDVELTTTTSTVMVKRYSRYKY